MSAFFDTKFPTLESVAAYLDRKEDEESAEVEVDKKSDDEAINEAVKRKQAKFQHALKYDRDLNNDEFSVDTILHFTELKALIAQKQLLEQIMAVETQLELPADNALEIVAALRKFAEIAHDNTQTRELQDLAAAAETSIKNRWFDAELQTRSTHLRDVLTSVKWPNAVPINSETVKNAIENSAELSMQQTFAELARPIGDRIIYNFQKSPDTARADKPEWLFQYLVKLLRSKMPWISAVLQQFVDKPMDHLIQALSPYIVQTCHKTYTIDGHFVSELLEFVSTLESTFLCSSDPTTNDLLNQVLTPTLLTKYIDNEEEAQLKAAQRLLSSGSQAIDYDADVLCARPTFLAVNIRQMLSELDYLLRLDARAVMKQVHFSIITVYQTYLETKQESYDRAHSSLARAVGTAGPVDDSSSGNDKRVRLEDTSDAEYLARIFGSSSFFILVLERMSVDLVIANSPDLTEEIAKFGKLFAELRDRSGERLSKVLVRDVQKALKDYFQVNWQHNASTSRTVMRSAVESLHSSIEFLNKLCPTSRADRARISIPSAEALAKMFWRMVIQANLFSPEAAVQLRGDIELLWSALQLPIIALHTANIEATHVLEQGRNAETSELTEDQIDGLLRRRV